MSYRSFALLVLCVALTSNAWAEVPSGPGDWPQWRGPHGDGISRETGLLKEWPEGGPRVLWQIDSVGVGYSSLAIKNGRIYTLGDLKGVEHVICLNAKDGSIVWAVQPGPLAEQLAERVDKEFRELDKNKDGVVDEVESLSRFGWTFTKYDQPQPDTNVRNMATQRVEALLAQIDADHDGKLNYDEGRKLFGDTFDRMDEEDKSIDAKEFAAARAAEYFKLLDEDHDEKLSKKETQQSSLERQFGRFDEKDPVSMKGDELLTMNEVQQGLLKHEVGRDGVVSQAELLEYYIKNNVTGDGKLSVDELRAFFGGYRNGQGDGPRSTPTVDGDRVFIEGANGDVSCLEAATGKTVWYVSLTKDFGGSVPGWGYSESPLVVNELVIVTPGGKQGTVLALDKASGKMVWQSGGITERAQYATPLVATINGVPQIVQFANQSVFGVSLADGKLLWTYEAPANGTANCCTPIVEDNQVFAASAYGTGGGLAKIENSDEARPAEEVYFEKKMQCHHGGIVKIGDYMYSNAGGTLICMKFKTGEIAWQSRSAGKGSLVAADGMLYVLGEGHELALVEANPEAYHEHGKFKLQSHGRPAWAHPVVAGGVLYIRDQESLVAYNVKQ